MNIALFAEALAEQLEKSAITLRQLSAMLQQADGMCAATGLAGWNIDEVKGLSVRCRTALHREGLHTLGDVIKKRSDELLAIRNFGTTSLDELRNALEDLGLTLKGTHHKENGG